MLFSLLTLLLLLLHLHFLFLLFLLLLLYIHILLYLMSYLFLRACIVNPYIPTSPIMLMFPISGTVSSLYTFIVFAPDLFPASSIAFTVMAYSPSVCTFILVFISSTLFWFVIIWFVIASFTSYSYPIIFPTSYSDHLLLLVSLRFEIIHFFPFLSVSPFVPVSFSSLISGFILSSFISFIISFDPYPFPSSAHITMVVIPEFVISNLVLVPWIVFSPSVCAPDNV